MTQNIQQLREEFKGNVNVQLPLINIQKQIVAKLSAAQNCKTQLLARRAKLKELFASALRKSMHDR
ncbi:MAG: hypothetical protein AAB604_02365 [Patescibacteria group bacterium]